VITCRQRDVMELVTRQEAGQRFCTAILLSIDFAVGSVLASLHECWIACGLTTQNKSPTYFHPPVDIFCFPIILILLLFQPCYVVGGVILKLVLFKESGRIWI